MTSLTTIFGPSGFDATKSPAFEPSTPPEFAFSDALHAFGMEVDGPIIPGEIQRCRMTDQKRGNKRNGWYLYFGSDPGTGIAAGVFGDWRHDQRQYWSSVSERDMDARQQAAYQAHIKAMQAVADRERQTRQDEAAQEAASIINSAPLAASHDYLTRKQVKPYGLYTHEGALIIPMRNAQGDIRSLQRIYPNGDKRFLAGGQTRGCFHLIGSTLTEPTYLVEGYATGATIHTLTGKSVIVAFTSGNLGHTIEAIRSAGNHNKIIVAADNDRHTDGNPGITAASKAAEGHLGVHVVYPEFQGSEGTDFNDLAVGEGVGAVMRHLDLNTNNTGRPLLVSPADLKATAPSWIIKGVIPTEAIGVLFGPSSGGKSFAAIDMALCIAAGKDWHGRKMKQPGGVIYVCGEGQQGIANRLRAWEKYHKTPIDNLPIRITTAPVRFLDPAAKIALLDAIHIEAESIPGPQLIIVDTLNRNFGDGDENSTKDMTGFIDAITDVHKALGATVLIVHHTGLTDGDRARGNGSLKNACDFEIKHAMASKEGDEEKIFTLVGKKMKDGSEMAPCHFALKFVPLGADEDNETYGSCAIEMVPGDAVEGAAIADKITRGMGVNQLRVKEILAKYRSEILNNRPEITEVTIERQHLVDLLKKANCPPNKTSDWIKRAEEKHFLRRVNSILLEVTEIVTND